uniref:Mitochondrial potassium channel ATP-binding subunit n=1 Tax=Cairina moschata TaxID=8855 RepID=A0A8C3CE05_CAIMO
MGAPGWVSPGGVPVGGCSPGGGLQDRAAPRASPTCAGAVAPWGPWSGCSVPCGGGYRNRTRGGSPLRGLEFSTCNPAPCPGEPRLSVRPSVRPSVHLSVCLSTPAPHPLVPRPPTPVLRHTPGRTPQAWWGRRAACPATCELRARPPCACSASTACRWAPCWGGTRGLHPVPRPEPPARFPQGLLTFGYIALLSRVGEQVAASMRKALFISLLRQDVAFYDANRTGQLVNRLTADVQEFKSSFKLIISQGLRSSTQAAGCIVSLYLLSPKLTGLLLLVMPTLVGAGALVGSFLRSLSRRAQEQVAKATGVADEVLGNVRTVRAFAMEDQQAGLYCAEAERSSQLSQRLGLGIAAFQGLSNLALNGIVLGTIFVGGSLMAGNELSPGDLMSFLVASQTVQRSMANISILFGQVVRGLSAGARVLEFMTLEPKVPLRGGASIPSHSLLGHVAFNHVSFSYPMRPGHPVLRDFSLSLPPGKTVAIVGPSGGGKSTVAALLERFYEPTQGSITLDGHDISSLDPSWLRGQVIGFISQDPVLFGTTIMENIRFGKPGASDEEVYAAARLANADDFIRSFPEGYGTVVGERGTALSGGQRQRIAIARALLKDPAVLVLDEATSALDAESERVVQAALE